MFPAEPSGYPKNFRCIGVQENTIHLAWDKVPCLYQNGPIYGYELKTYYQPGISNLYYQTKRVPLEFTTSAVFTFQKREWVVKPGDQIGFTIAAFNDKGVGIDSPMLLVTPVS